MPNYEIPLPVGATGVRVIKGTDSYNINDAWIFNRSSEDGNIPILILQGSDYFKGEYLEGNWRKDWDTHIDADQTFVAKINYTNNQLEMLGEADVAGIAGSGYLNSKLPIPLVDGLQITLAFQVPIDDTGVDADRDVEFFFILGKNRTDNGTPWQNDQFYLNVNIDETGLFNTIKTRINNVTQPKMYDGKTYDDASTRGTGAVEGMIYRFVFHGKSGTSGAHVHIYLKQGETLATVGTENELSTSPYDIDDLLFDVAFPSFILKTQNIIHYDDANPLIVDYLKIEYPTDVHYEYTQPEASRNLADVEVWDGVPDANGSQRVFDKNHTFVNDPYIRNSLIQYHCDIGIINGNKISAYYNSGWVQISGTHGMQDGTDSLNYYANFIEFTHVSPEMATIKTKWTDTATDDDNRYVITEITIRRGKPFVEIKLTDRYPARDSFYLLRSSHSLGVDRMAYSGIKIADFDLLKVLGNTAVRDNFIITQDDEGDKRIMFISTNKKPSVHYYSTGRDLYIDNIIETDLGSVVICVGFSPFDENANLFREAENVTRTNQQRNHIDADHDGHTANTTLVTEANPDTNEIVKYEDDETIWADGKWTAGNDYDISHSENTTDEKSGSSCLDVDIVGVSPGTGYANCGVIEDYGAGTEEDWSGRRYWGMWIYGDNCGQTIICRLYDDSYVDFVAWNVTDNFTGWKWFCFDMEGTPDGELGVMDFTKIRAIHIRINNISGACSFKIDHMSIFDGVWTAQLNVAVTVNDSTNPQEGQYVVKSESQASGWIETRLDYADLENPITNITKFDYLKFVAWCNSGGRTLQIYLVDSDGDNVLKAQSINTTPTVYTINLPHSSSDLQGWTENGTFNFSDLSHISIQENATGAGEIWYLDQMYFNIGETTTRGRGETLSGGSAVQFYYTNQNVYYSFTAGTHLPEGRYVVAVRAKDTDQVADDFGMCVQNNSDTTYRHEENDFSDLNPETLTSSFHTYFMVFDITAEDVTGTDTIWIYVKKRFSTENSIFVDSINIFPLNNGESWPQDLAHNVLRNPSLFKAVEIPKA